jgi:UDP-GlcNAc:undecaprenyl-phosphate GlcNAc-1-phosphate transferase
MRISFLQILTGFALSFLLSLTIVGVMRKIAIRFNVMDAPDSSRKLQANPVPYLGGVGLILAFLICLSLGYLTLSPSDSLIIESISLLAPCLLMGLVGLWDDLRNLSAHFRLMVQVVLGLICSIFITFGSTSGNATSNETINILITILWLVGITNAVNFFDNYDGGAAIATSIAAFGMFVYSILTGQLYISAVSVVLIGALLGFFFWNRKPARVYMGDAGALFVGLLLACLAVRIDPVAPSKIVSLSVPIFFLALPILDTITVVISRLRRGRSPLQGGLDHLSHRLANASMKPRKIITTFAIVGFQFQMMAIATIFVNDEIGKLIVGLFLIEFIYLLRRYLRIKVNYEL